MRHGPNQGLPPEFNHTPNSDLDPLIQNLREQGQRVANGLTNAEQSASTTFPEEPDDRRRQRPEEPSEGGPRGGSGREEPTPPPPATGGGGDRGTGRDHPPGGPPNQGRTGFNQSGNGDGDGRPPKPYEYGPLYEDPVTGAWVRDYRGDTPEYAAEKAAYDRWLRDNPAAAEHERRRERYLRAQRDLEHPPGQRPGRRDDDLPLGPHPDQARLPGHPGGLAPEQPPGQRPPEQPRQGRVKRAWNDLLGRIREMMGPDNQGPDDTTRR